MDKLKIRAVSAPWNSGVDLLIRQGRAVATVIEYEEAEHGIPQAPTIKIGMDEAQTLMDDLWVAGLRPTEGAGSAGALAATERHLEDMRSIAFGLIQKEPKS